MHPEISQMIVVSHTAELRATARTAGLVRKTRGERADTPLTIASSGSSAAAGRGPAGRRRLLARLIPGRTQPA